MHFEVSRGCICNCTQRTPLRMSGAYERALCNCALINQGPWSALQTCKWTKWWSHVSFNSSRFAQGTELLRRPQVRPYHTPPPHHTPPPSSSLTSRSKWRLWPGNTRLQGTATSYVSDQLLRVSSEVSIVFRGFVFPSSATERFPGCCISDYEQSALWRLSSSFSAWAFSKAVVKWTDSIFLSLNSPSYNVSHVL
jgi:hypothetical protein